MPFRGEVTLKLLRVHKWKLTKPFTYITQDEEKITVKRGFITDGASIPKLFWSVFGGPLSGRYIRSAIIHDYLLSIDYPRKRADQIFQEGMKEEGAWLPKRKLLYWGVRLFSIFRRK